MEGRDAISMGPLHTQIIYLWHVKHIITDSMAQFRIYRINHKTNIQTKYFLTVIDSWIEHTIIKQGQKWCSGFNQHKTLWSIDMYKHSRKYARPRQQQQSKNCEFDFGPYICILYWIFCYCGNHYISEGNTPTMDRDHTISVQIEKSARGQQINPDVRIGRKGRRQARAHAYI